jgi:hypothetical protein
VIFELRDPFQGRDLECRRIAGNRRITRSLHLRHAAVQRRNEFVQFTKKLSADQRHPRAPYCGVCRRESFQTSPQLVQRQ